MKTVAIIGAGVSGLAAIKSCIEDGLEPTCFERTATLGGMWYYTNDVRPGQASTSKTTVANSSKEISCFSDYPMPDDFPNFPHHAKMLQYIRSYATNFKLTDYIRFNADVLTVKMAPDFLSTGCWVVETYNKDTDTRTSATFDAVLVGNGHHSEPHQPKLPGQNVFQGKVIHSLEFRNHHGYEDKRVVVIGLGNSAGDVAVDLSRIAKEVYLSARRGCWIVDRIANHGFPIDLFGVRRCFFALKSLLPLRLFEWLIENKINSKFDHASYSLRPSHAFSSQNPIINDELPNRIVCGTVIVKPSIARLTETGVEFADGTYVDDVDVVICATGYLVTFPFIDEDIIRVRHNVIDLYQLVFPPDLQHPTLAVIGATQQFGSSFPLIEMQCRWATRVFKGECKLPSKQSMWNQITERKKELGPLCLNTLRYTLKIEWIPYMDKLAEDIGCKPNIAWMFLHDPLLAWKCFFGPCTPYQFRLVGPGQWTGARDAILTSWQRVLRPLKGKSFDSSESCNAVDNWRLKILIGGFIVALLVLSFM